MPLTLIVAIQPACPKKELKKIIDRPTHQPGKFGIKLAILGAYSTTSTQEIISVHF